MATIFLILFSLNASAKKTSVSSKKPGFYSVKTGLHSYGYYEPSVMNLRGFVAEVGGSYSRSRGSLWYYQADALVQLGILNYSGSVISIDTGQRQPLTAPSFDLITDFRGLGGMQAKFGKFFVKSGIGLGFRYLINRVQNDAGYLRAQTYFYMPIWSKLEMSLKNGNSLYLGGEYDWFLSGENNSHLNKVLVFKQSDGWGAKVYLGYKWGKRKRPLSVELSYQYWWVGRSTSDTTIINNIQETFYEPENISHVFGISLNFDY